MRSASSRMRGRAGASFGLPLPRLPEAERERIRGAGALARSKSSGDRRGKDLDARGRQRTSGNLSLLSELRFDSRFVIEGWPGVTAVPLGAFADPQFPAPKFSVYEHRNTVGQPC